MRRFWKLKLKNNNKSTGKIVNVAAIIFLILVGFFIWQKNVEAGENKFIITEIMYDQFGNNKGKSDWVEIFAKKDFVIDKNWRIVDEEDVVKNKETGFYKKCHLIKDGKGKTLSENSVKIKKGEYVVFADNVKKFKSEYKNFQGKIFDTVLSLRSRGDDGIWISEDKCKTFSEKKKYNSKKDGANGNGYSLEFDFRNKKWRESYVLGGTPGRKNSQKKKYKHTVTITELLANPVGEDKKGEYIELYNFGEDKINLKNWSLGDLSGKKFIVGDIFIAPKEYYVFYRKDFGFALNNSGQEKVFLFDPNKDEVMKVEYFGSKEGISYAFDFRNKKWRPSKKNTPGEQNLFVKKPKFKVVVGKNRYKNVYLNFAVKFKNKKDKKRVKIRWNFGDGRRSYLIKTRHKYLKTGKYCGWVEVIKGVESFKKEFCLKIKKFPEKKVKIISLMPNPKGKDSELEWLEIKNYSHKKINLKGWSIFTGKKKDEMVKHLIKEDLIIKANKSKKIITGKDEVTFSLNNKKCRVELRYPNGKIASVVKYEKPDGVKDDEVYQKVKGKKWRWSDLENNESKKELKNVGEIGPNEERKIEGDKNKEKQKSEIKGAMSVTTLNEKKYFLAMLNYPLNGGDEKFLFKIRKIKLREENGRYYFNPKIKTKEVYWKKFLRKLMW